MDVTGDGSEVQGCKEQYCIGTWNVRSMNQSELELVRQEMSRVNVDILGISELKWTGMDEFNSDDPYVSLPLDAKYLLTVTPVLCRCRSRSV